MSNELDRLMATHPEVMGWEYSEEAPIAKNRYIKPDPWPHYNDPSKRKNNTGALAMLNDAEIFVMMVKDWNPTAPDGMNQAMMCVEKYPRTVEIIHYEHKGGYEVSCLLKNGAWDNSTFNKSAPLAICQAIKEALKGMGVENK